MLEIHRNPKQKEFLKSCEGFLRAALPGHGHPGPFWKIAKMALFDPCMEFGNFLGQMTSFEVLWKLFDFIQKMSQVPSNSVQVLIWENKLDYLKNPSQDFKNYFCLWFLWTPSNANMYIRGFTKFGIKVLWRLQKSQDNFNFACSLLKF